MTDGTKDWANIRIEEPVRDEARDDSRTYTNIMRAGLEALYADVAVVRSDGTVELRPSDEPITNDAPEPCRPDASEYEDERLNALPDDLREQLDRIESAATTAEARTGRIEGTLEDMGAGR